MVFACIEWMVFFYLSFHFNSFHYCAYGDIFVVLIVQKNTNLPIFSAFCSSLAFIQFKFTFHSSYTEVYARK